MLTITAKAAQHFKRFLIKEQTTDPTVFGFRIGILQRGCSGFSYNVEPVRNVVLDDHNIETSGITLVVAQAIMPYIKGTTIDCAPTQGGLGTQLIFNNPNAIGSCGCGESFTIDNNVSPSSSPP